ncbi:MAG: DDE-type integrase/transposase/recombinase [Caedimonadaceae bacterium]|nr:MAG: DDE-type integrase/transposase/recombinase [Caedimonadaceae bacterium]
MTIRHSDTSAISGTSSIDEIGDPSIQRVVREFEDVFPPEIPGGLPPKHTVQCEIKLRGDAKVQHRAPYRTAHDELEEIERQLKLMLERGWIRPSTSEWGAPIIFACKKGGSLRMCIDYRALNAQTIVNRFTLPHPTDLIQMLKGAKYITRLDQYQAFHQIRMNENSVHMTAFTTPFGSFEWLVMPMGISSGPSYFQYGMNAILGHLIGHGVLVYIDDLIVYADTLERHLEILREVLAIFRKNRYFCNLKKCEFGLRELEFLGFIVGNDQVKPTPEKINIIKSWKTPDAKDTSEKEARTQLHSFIGFTQFYRRFIKDYGKITRPLFDLLTPKSKYEWKPDVHGTAFEALKTEFSEALSLRIPDRNQPFYVTTDASDYGMGMILEQEHDGRLVPVCFEHRYFNKHEKNYPVREKELLAIKNALQIWRHYLVGNKVIVYTDHESLKYFKSQSLADSPGRLARWAELFQEYDMEIRYIKGKSNIPADSISRAHFVKPKGAIQLNALAAMTVSVVSGSVLSEYLSDTRNREMYERLADDLKERDHMVLEKDNGIYYVKHEGLRKILIPDDKTVKGKIYFEMHDSPTAGHGGISKTLNAICKHFYWEQMRQEIRQYVKSCDSCQKAKASNQKEAGLLQSIPVAPTPFHSISMDFITQLPKTKQGYDAIYVVVDRLSKYGIFVPMKGDSGAMDVAELFLNNVFKNFGLPTQIISDRDARFTSLFWKSLFQRLGTKISLTTAYHPQADGQTERTNRTLEDFLRHFVNSYHTDWDEQLPLAQFSYNNSVSVSTGYTPFQIVHGVSPTTPIDLFERKPDEQLPEVVVTEAYINRCKDVVNCAVDNIKKAQAIQAKYYDATHRDDKFKQGDLVLLSTENLKFKNVSGSQKFNMRFVGPYKVLSKTSDVNYRLQLPDDWKIHNVFHVSKLRRYTESDDELFPNRLLRPAPDLIQGELEWEVEAVLDDKMVGKTKKYLVRWKGYDAAHDTWQTASDLKHAKETLEEYKAQKEMQSGKSARTRSKNGKASASANKTSK